MSVAPIRQQIAERYKKFKESGEDVDLLDYYCAWRRYYRYQLKVEWSATVKEQLEFTEEKIRQLDARVNGGGDLPCGSCRTPHQKKACGPNLFIVCAHSRLPRKDLIRFGCSSYQKKAEV